MNTALVYPMFALVVLTFAVGVALFRSRVQGLREGAIRLSYFKNMSGEGQPTERMNTVSRHFTNLFELPVLFNTGCIVAMILPITSPWVLVWAWAFVALRIAQACIHLGANKVRHRALTYFLGFAAVLALWAHIAIFCLPQ